MKVSVAVLTYGHARFIRQTLDAALAQRTNFPFEIVIADDASTDGTGEIALEYAARHPDRVRVLPRDKWLGSVVNCDRMYRACRGEYIAMCEGDDYWTHPDKLQRQVDWLDAHPETVLCYHRVEAFDDASGEVKFELPHPADRIPEIRLEYIVSRNPVPTCSAVFRTRHAPVFGEAATRLNIGDWPTYSLALRHGSGHYIDECWARYRLHSTSLHSSQSVAIRCSRTADALEWVLPQMPGQHQRALRHTIMDLRLRETDEWIQQRDLKRARIAWSAALRHSWRAPTLVFLKRLMAFQPTIRAWRTR
jgi:glycosyltransferase involved in cell wall biosynthesis